MKIVIDIPEGDYKRIQDIPDAFNSLTSRAYSAIRSGTPLPKGHGRLIDVDAIPHQVELKGFLMQDDMHLVTIDRIKAALNEAPTIIEADKE